MSPKLKYKRAAMKMWKWLSETGLAKRDFIDTHKTWVGRYKDNCPLCECFGAKDRVEGMDCPLYGCTKSDSTYWHWYTATQPALKKKLATEIYCSIKEWKI
jgi:hypothetical protein